LRRRRKMGAQVFRYLRWIAKMASLPFVLVGVFLFIIQFLATAIESGVLLWIFIVGWGLWTFDTVWGTMNNAREIRREIERHRTNSTTTA